MYKKIDVYINGVYQFSSNRYKTCKELYNHIREVKRIQVASIPIKFITVNDNDKIVCRYSK